MLIVAVTGGIASGKTSVSNAFAFHDVPIVDADDISRKVVEPGSEPLEKLEGLYGDKILNTNGTLNRATLKKIIFSDLEQKRQVEKILHPAIANYSRKLIQQYKSEGFPYCIHVIPLLFETGQADNFEHILLVDIPENIQLSRLIKRDNPNSEDAQKIIDSQASRKQRLSIATDILCNHGDIVELKSKVLLLHNKYLNLSGVCQQ